MKHSTISMPHTAETTQNSEQTKRIREIIHGKWMKGKRYVDLLSVKGASPLTFAERLVYSFTLWLQRQQQGQSKPFSEIASRLGIGRKQVADAATSLQSRGLVEILTGKSNAKLLLPSSAPIPSYIAQGNNATPASNHYYLLVDKATLRSRDTALLTILHSLAATRGTVFIKNPLSGLSKLTTVCPKQIKRSLKSLQEQGFLVTKPGNIALKEPSEEGLKNFVDVGWKNDISTFEPFQCGNSKFECDFFYLVNLYIKDYQFEQLDSKWTAESTQEFWRECLKTVRLTFDGREEWRDLIEEFLSERYPAIWITAEQQHDDTGVANNCRFLLKRMVVEELERMSRERMVL